MSRKELLGRVQHSELDRRRRVHGWRCRDVSIHVMSRSETGSWASSEGARRTMVANRRVDTKPEVALRSALHRLGLRFRKDKRIDLPRMRVRPDVVFSAARVVVYCDGCFWHRCPIHATFPKANADYWRLKLAANVRRDRESDRALKEAGWRVVRVWEHENPIEAAKQIAVLVRARVAAVSGGELA